MKILKYLFTITIFTSFFVFAQDLSSAKIRINENNFDGEKIFNQALDQTENTVINENFKLAQSLGLRGTPASVINDSIYPGYIKYEVLSNLVK